MNKNDFRRALWRSALKEPSDAEAWRWRIGGLIVVVALVLKSMGVW